ncbi:MAG: dihydropyrimidinase [Erysipelotrichaceae bacterium]
MKLLIKNGIVLTEEYEINADVLVENETIKTIGNNLTEEVDVIYDATNKYVFAGGVDEHTHFGSFNSMSFETSLAAAIGGTTTIVDFVPQNKNETLIEAINRHKEIAMQNSYVDFAFHSMLMSVNDKSLADIKNLPKYGVVSLKMFMAYKGTPYYARDEDIIKAMKIAKEYGITFMLHAEDSDIIDLKTKELLDKNLITPYYHAIARPNISEVEAVKRAIEFANKVNIPLFFVHISTSEALDLIQTAKQNGSPIFCETCTHYLTLTKKDLKKKNLEGAKFICSPPLRNQKDINQLWNGINNGLIEAVSSDHCAVKGGFKEKINNYTNFSKVPNGIPGVQNRLEILWNEGVCKGRITRTDFVRIFSSRPAEICGLDNKGKLLPGFDADIVIFNPNLSHTISDQDSFEGIDYSAFNGFKVSGSIEKVILRGKLIVDNGKYVGNKNGQFIFETPNAYCYQKKNMNL